MYIFGLEGTLAPNSTESSGEYWESSLLYSTGLHISPMGETHFPLKKENRLIHLVIGLLRPINRTGT